MAKVDETLLLDVVEKVEALSVQLGLEARHLRIDEEGVLALKVDQEMDIWILNTIELAL